MTRLARVWIRCWCWALPLNLIGGLLYAGIMGTLLRPGWLPMAQMFLLFFGAMQLMLGTVLAVVGTLSWLARGRPEVWPPASPSEPAGPGLTPGPAEPPTR